MKKLLLSLSLLSCFQFAIARKVVVTSSSDNVTSPTIGMLRYLVDNAQTNDTITFNVVTVNLLEEIDVASSMVIDGGIDKTTINGGGNDRIFNVTAYYATDIVIKNLKFINGKKTDDIGWGGAMYVFISSGTVNVDHCIFSNNEAIASSDGQGGALRCNGGTFTNCSFFNNKVSGTGYALGGGGVMAVGGLFINCVFSNNQADWGGGVYTSDGIFYNCTFSNNSATSTSSSGGIQAEGSSKFVNCIAYNNYVNSKIGNINAIDNSEISYCAFESSNDFVGADGNIGLSSSPFKGGGGNDSLSLVQGACVDAGSSSGITVLNTDIAGNIRVIGNVIDIGAYEFNSTPYTSIVKSSEIIIAPILYPNPSTGTLYFNSSILQSNNLDIEIFDLLGNLILSQSQINSSISISQSGIFQVKVKSNNSVYCQKIVIE